MARSGKILITGAAGFIGVALCRRLANRGLPIRAVIRRGGTPLPTALSGCLDDVVAVDTLVEALVWEKLLDGVERVVHLAARVHCSDQRESSSNDLFFHDNLDAGIALGEAAVRFGIQRLIFLSTIKVNGEGGWGPDHHPFKNSDRPRPQGPYAISKWRTEQELQRLCGYPGGPELTIIRPPLVYGPGVKGNFAALLGWLNRGLPILIPRPVNRRSMIYLGNLVDLIEFCLFHADAGGRVLLPADREDWSMAGLVNFLARGLGRRARILQIPESWLRWGGKIVQREEHFMKMFGSLRVDSRALAELGWHPPMSENDILLDFAPWLRETYAKH